MQLRVKAWIEHGGRMAFGEGLRELLSGIGERGSIAAAASSMGLAYREAWGRLRQTEATLGAPLLERRTGGPRGGGAALTPYARQLLEAYSTIEKRLAETAVQLEAELLSSLTSDTSGA